MAQKITLAYIAEKAGVSKSAASQALLGGGGKTTKVSPKTAARIQQIAQKLNYRPNGVARSLSSGKTYSIGLLFGGHDLFYMELSTHIQQFLLKHGYIGIYTSWNSEEEFDKACNAILNHGVDGIITAHHTGIFTENVPVVLYKNRHPHYDYLKLSSEKNIEKALSYLLSLGHQKIGFADDNQKPFFEAMKKFSLSVNPDWVMPCDGYLKSGVALSQYFMCLPERPTALIVRNDMVSIAMIAEFQKHGIMVPRDISILSFGNIILSQYTTPALTTFDSQPREAAEFMVNAMLQRLSNPELPQIAGEITPELLIRASCSPISNARVNKR